MRMFRSATLIVLVVNALACGSAPASEGSNPFGDELGGTGPGAETGDGPGNSSSGAVPGETGSDDTPATTAPVTTTPAETSESSGDDSGTSSGESSTDGGSSSESSTGTPIGEESTGIDTYDDGTVSVEVSVQSMWEAGECDDVVVTNVSAETITWEIELELPGTIDMLWNAELTEMDGVGTFVGVAFNAELDPGEAAMFGFCVTY